MFIKSYIKTREFEVNHSSGKVITKTRKSKWALLQCDNCDRQYERQINSGISPSRCKEGVKHFCDECPSKKLAAEISKDSRRQNLNENLIGDKIITSHGYVSLYVGDSYKSSRVKSGRIYEHHYIAETVILNGPIPKTHCVHHIDFDKTNNSADNLDVLTIKEHNNCHASNDILKELYTQGIVYYCPSEKKYLLTEKYRK